MKNLYSSGITTARLVDNNISVAKNIYASGITTSFIKFCNGYKTDWICEKCNRFVGRTTRMRKHTIPDDCPYKLEIILEEDKH